MFVTREQLENQEAERLAGYGMKCRESRGRKYPEEEHPSRTCFQRDRDRIVHCEAFHAEEFAGECAEPGVAVARRCRWSACCASISSSSGLRSPIPAPSAQGFRGSAPCRRVRSAPSGGVAIARL